ncbi:MAG: hypothetical protein JXR37_28265 [Kiritimatiellae bacterium]|nr:hypothetical protein [Kiritimatiellia bacterium]
MSDNDAMLNIKAIWGDAAPREAVRELANLVTRHVNGKLDITGGATAFSVRPDPDARRQGILAASGKLDDDETAITMSLHLATMHPEARVRPKVLVKIADVLRQSGSLHARSDGDRESWWVELRVKAVPLSTLRAGNVAEQLNTLDACARLLQAELPSPHLPAHIEEAFQEFRDVVQPVFPAPDDNSATAALMRDWATQTADLLACGLCVAVEAPYPILIEFALAHLSQAHLAMHGKPIGRLCLPTVDAQRIIQLCAKAPAPLEIAANALTLGVSIYDLGRASTTLIDRLCEAGAPAIFTGAQADLQLAFGGGQGGRNDPWRPAVRRPPADIPIEHLARFALRAAARKTGGLPAADETRLAADVCAALIDSAPGTQQRMVGPVATRAVKAFEKGSGARVDAKLAASLSSHNETLAGLEQRAGADRTPHVHEMWIRALTAPNTLTTLKQSILGQDDPLLQLFTSLQTQILTRPAHQPLLALCEGPSGTGKSSCAGILARLMDSVYVTVDGASISDHYQFTSILLGAATGIVGSWRAGTLERAAKSWKGAVVEICDIHAVSARLTGMMADVFLSIAETGSAQAATGHTFSCANLVLLFTLNLPQGDESARNPIGFGDAAPGFLRERVLDRLRTVLSPAFLSRCGEPIVFGELPADVLPTILLRGVSDGLRSAAERLHIPVAEFRFAENLGHELLNTLRGRVKALGARTLLEHGRRAAASAFTRFVNQNKKGVNNCTLAAKAVNGELALSIQKSNAKR